MSKDGVMPTTMMERVASRPSRRERDQGGYVIPMFALVLTVLMAFAGLGVDVWQWWHAAQRTQRAADAAALGGVVFMPADFASAQSTAQSLAGSNGYPVSAVTVAQGDRPNRLRVDVTESVSNNFLSLIGIDTTTVSRHAVAEFSGPIPLGSPANQMGNQPVGAGDANWAGDATDTAATNPFVWTQIAGPGNRKNNGDRFTSNDCATVGPTNSVFACTGPNQEYRGAYLYGLRLDVGSGPGQVNIGETVAIEVYDPAFVQAGDNCTQYDPDVGNDTGANAAGGAIRTSLAAAGARYDSNDLTNRRTYCTGDHHINAPGTGNTRRTNYPPVTFTTLEADNTPWTASDNDPLTLASCSARTFRPYGRNSNGTANTTETPANLPSQVTTAGTYANEVFHRWVRVCSFTVGSSVGITGEGEWDLYFEAETTTGYGHNRFAIRAAVPDSSGPGGDGRGVSLFAVRDMPLYQNAAGSTATFYLTRVPPGASGRILQVEFFDVGDGQGSGDIRIVPPPEYSTGNVSGCTATRAPNATPAPQIINGCTLDNVSSTNYQAQRTVMEVPIPADYACDISDITECWWRVEFSWSQTIQDTTTWSASITGDPVRLIE